METEIKAKIQNVVNDKKTPEEIMDAVKNIKDPLAKDPLAPAEGKVEQAVGKDLDPLAPAEGKVEQAVDKAEEMIKATPPLGSKHPLDDLKKLKSE